MARARDSGPQIESSGADAVTIRDGWGRVYRDCMGRSGLIRFHPQRWPRPCLPRQPNVRADPLDPVLLTPALHLPGSIPEVQVRVLDGFVVEAEDVVLSLGGRCLSRVRPGYEELMHFVVEGASWLMRFARQNKSNLLAHYRSSIVVPRWEVVNC